MRRSLTLSCNIRFHQSWLLSLLHELLYSNLLRLLKCCLSMRRRISFGECLVKRSFTQSHLRRTHWLILMLVQCGFSDPEVVVLCLAHHSLVKSESLRPWIDLGRHQSPVNLRLLDRHRVLSRDVFLWIISLDLNESVVQLRFIRVLI